MLATLVLGVLAALALILPLLQGWLEQRAHAQAEQPNPILAFPEETREILFTVMQEWRPTGVPAPPPGPGEAPPNRTPPVLILSNQTLQLSPPGTPPPLTAAISDSDPWLEEIAPRKWRTELVIANAQPHDLPQMNLPGVRLLALTEILRPFENKGWWNDFYREFPDTAGYAQITWPVLSQDRRLSLIFVEHYCEGLCGSGVLYLLTRTDTGWLLVSSRLLWIS